MMMQGDGIYYEPLSVPIGLIIMVLYSFLFSNNKFKL